MIYRVLSLAAVLVAASLSIAVATAAAINQTVSPADKLQVWNVNTHVMSLPGNPENTDYRDFVAFITTYDAAHAPYFPDIVTLQEVGSSPSRTNCNEYRDLLIQRTGRTYQCRGANKQGGSAIVWRADTANGLSLADPIGDRDDIAPLKLRTNAHPDSCRFDTDTQDPWTVLALRLTDAASGKHVSVASIHLPFLTGGPKDADCAWENMKIISPRINDLGSAGMKIMGGDWNHQDAEPVNGVFAGWECWYNGTNIDLGQCGNANLGWKDVVYRACSSASNIFDCMQTNHWTQRGPNEDKRIDFVFAKTQVIENVFTVPFETADAIANPPSGDGFPYSDHRGQGALVTYLVNCSPC
jgi:hypothetical protein